MRLICISDTHGSHKGTQLPAGDVLIHSGDCTGSGHRPEIEHFLDWFASQPHTYKILVAGNHDWIFQRDPKFISELLAARPGVAYLQDSGIEIEGHRFWGSPWQPWFNDWAFNLPRGSEALREVWSKIPTETEVLITHTPPYGILDQVQGGPHFGCEELKNRLATILPRVHIFGHIHDGFGVAQSSVTTYVNACLCDENYRPNHAPIVIDIESDSVKTQGIERNRTLERLEYIQETLDRSEVDARAKELHPILVTHAECLRAMAEVRGINMDAVLEEYVIRGLRSDLSKHFRSENKPNKRPVPYTKLTWGGDEG